jgi:hypothetical protein
MPRDIAFLGLGTGCAPQRLTTAQRDALVAPLAGTVIYNTTTAALEWWSGAAWGPLGGGATARDTATITTASLAAGAQATGTVALGKSCEIIAVSSPDSYPFRLRLYSTAAARTADLSRPPTSLPAAGTEHQVILDLLLNADTGYDWICSPRADGSNGDEPPAANLYYTLDNLDTVSRVISVDILHLTTET